MRETGSSALHLCVERRTFTSCFAKQHPELQTCLRGKKIEEHVRSSRVLDDCGGSHTWLLVGADSDVCMRYLTKSVKHGVARVARRTASTRRIGGLTLIQAEQPQNT